MKIVAIADTHMCHADLKMPKGDMLLVAGDCLGYGTIEEAIEFNKYPAIMIDVPRLILKASKR